MLTLLMFNAPAHAEPKQYGSVMVEELAAGLEHPWGLAQLPNGAWLVTERPGRLRLYQNGQLSAPIQGVPVTEEFGQGGLLDVALDPGFAKNNQIYLSFARIEKGKAGTALARATLQKSGASAKLTNLTVLYEMANKSSAGQHFGSRIVFQDNTTLWLTIGDRGRDKDAQNPKLASGSILRLKTDGSIPNDNPFVGKTDYLPELWSIGHRNPQGAAKHPITGELWTVEHGARGGDEINIPQAGRNYGWPEISYGRHYSGLKIGSGTQKDGLEQPIYYWDPSIAPSGMAFYSHNAFPQWQNSVFVGALKDRMLVRLGLDGNGISNAENLLIDYDERIRAVAQGLDGAIYILTDSPDGVLARVTPASE
jgi:glucose/arabinose dehydrogenase